MVAKNTILSKADTELMQEMIIRFGVIVTTKQAISVMTSKYTKASAYNRINYFSKNGWFARLKNGLYMIVTDFVMRGSGNLSLHAASHALNPDSYISFEHALSYHHLFDQMLKGMQAVTYKRARKYNVLGSRVEFSSIRKELYFGFNKSDENGLAFNIASAEKAILDILYFKNESYYVSLLWDIIKSRESKMDDEMLSEYAIRFGDSMIRKVGFLLDRALLDSRKLYAGMRKNKNHIRLSRDASVFDSKWRVYYDNEIIDKN